MNILGCVFEILCSIILPLTLAVVFCVRKKESWKPILFGALTFSFFQVLIRVPVLQLVLSKTAWFIAMSATQPILYALFLGGTAALFEEGGRFVVMALFLKKQRSVSDGIAFGVGHGGIEAILFAGINAVAMLAVSVFPTTPDLLFAAGRERLSAITMQIAFSVMVMKCLREKKFVWLLIAFVLHTAVDFVSVYAAASLGTWGIEVLLLATAALMAWFVYSEYKKSALSGSKGS